MAKKKAASTPRPAVPRPASANATARTPAPTDDEIREAAYHRYLRRGAGHGGAFDDWLEAEKELRARKKR